MWEPVAQRLVTCQIYDHQSNLNQGGMPLMVIDAWEHAYYLQYKNVKAEFFKAVWNLWNWDDIADRLEAAREVNILLPKAVEAAGRAT
jgi:Fe-Mn family superoxide dismutase